MGLVVDLPAQRLGPEARETERIVRIEAESDEPRSHPDPPYAGQRHVRVVVFPCDAMRVNIKVGGEPTSVTPHGADWIR